MTKAELRAELTDANDIIEDLRGLVDWFLTANDALTEEVEKLRRYANRTAERIEDLYMDSVYQTSSPAV